MSAPDLDDILRKVQALLSKGDPDNGATEAESLAFLGKANELMTKHGIKEAMLNKGGSKSTSADVVRHDIKLGPKKARYHNVFRAAAYFANVRFLFSTWTDHQEPVKWKRTKYVAIFIGLEADIRMALLAWPIIDRLMSATPVKRANALGVPNDRAFRNGYYEGAEAGIRAKCAEARRAMELEASAGEKQEWGLVLVNKEAIVNKWIDDNLLLGKGKKATRKESTEGWMAGHRDGKNLSLHGGELV